MTQTYRDILADYFRAHRGEWVDGLTLAGLAGAYAWRSRISDVRVQLGMPIENRQRKVGRRTVSEYKFTPTAPRFDDLLQISEAP